MKKFGTRLMSLCLSLLLLLSLAPSALAFAPQPEPPKEIAVYVDGEPLVSDVAPYIKEGRTMVPLRAIFEALGAGVEWDNDDRSVTAQKGNTAIQLWIGVQVALINEEAMLIDVAPEISGGRTMVPARFVSEALGAEVEWDNDDRIVRITTNAGGSGGVKIMVPVVPIKITYALTLEATQADTGGATRADFCGSLTFTTELSDTPVAAKNRQVGLYTLDGGERQLVATVTTDSAGLFSYSILTSEPDTYVAVFSSGSGKELAVSDTVDVSVRNAIGKIGNPSVPIKITYNFELQTTTLHAAPDVIGVEVKGSLTMKLASSDAAQPVKNREVTLYTLNGGKRQLVKTATTDDAGMFVCSFIASKSATYVVVYKSANGADLAVSKTFDVSVLGK